VVQNVYFCRCKINKTMSYPVGHFNCKLDAKGRLVFPSEYKEQLGSQVEEGFVFHPGLHAKCLELYTKQDWDELQDKLRNQLSQFKAQQEAVMRRYNAGARFAKLDGNGRLQIPKDLIEKGQLDKDIIITSVTTKMEIWDKSLYEESIATALTDEEFFNILDNIN